MRNFRRYKVFISSTFRDMDFERDVIKFNVIPRINAELRKYDTAVDAVDLRIGINTGELSEAEAAKKVLNVCTQTIDTSRPFFIGLIGERYGWIPSESQWQNFISRLPEEIKNELKDTYGKSVTEIEIVHGALSQRALDNFHSIFLMRNPDSYEGIPAWTVTKYVDNDPGQQAKLQNLKSMIRDRIAKYGGDDDMVVPYSLKWDKKAKSFSEDSEFENLVYEVLLRQILKEIDQENLEEDWQLEKHAAEAALSSKLDYVSTELPYMNKMFENTCFVGDYGSGRSTILANQWRMYTGQTDDICLIACLKTSEMMQYPRYLLTMWCMELATILEEEPCDQKKFLTDSCVGIQTICDDFYYMVKKANDHGRRVTVFIDDVDTFMKQIPQGAPLPWLDFRVNIIATSSDFSYRDMMPYHLYVDFVELDDFAKSLQTKLISELEKKYFLELPQKLINKITKKSHTPGYVNSLYRYFGMMDSADFDELRGCKDYQKALEKYLTDIFNNCFLEEDDEIMLPSTLLSEICFRYGFDEEWYQALFACLSASPCGLTISELRGLADDDWDETEWQQIKYFMQDYLDEDFSSGKIYSKFDYFGMNGDAPYSILYDYFKNFDEPRDKDIFAYCMLRSERGAEDFTEEAFPLSSNVVYSLLNAGWFTNGDMEKYCSQLGNEQQHALMLQFDKQLKQSEASTVLCPIEILHAFENFALLHFEYDENEIEGVTEDYYTYKILYSENISEALKKIFEIAPELDTLQTIDFEINDYAEKSYDYYEKGMYLDELKTLAGSVEILNKQIKNQDRINGENILEVSMLTLLHVYGAAYRVLNDEPQTKKVDSDTIASIATFAEDGFVTSYLRLRQGYPFNNSLKEVAIIGERCAYDIMDFTNISSHSNAIRSAVAEILELMSKL